MSIFSSLGIRAKSAWNAFFNKDPTFSVNYGPSYSYRQQHYRSTSYRRDNSIVTAVLTRFSVDCAGVEMRHVVLDEEARFKGDKDSELNSCLTLEANLDQTGRAFMQDVVHSMLDEGSVAIVPVDTTNDPTVSDSYDVLSMRTGRILEWYPQHVKVEVYNENTGKREELILEKRMVCLVENPFYPVMNEPNSVMQRLIRKFTLLDIFDEKNSSGKLDLIISFPHIINTERRKAQAESRRSSIEDQLVNSKYGIAYTDGTEHITQLNRPIENNLLTQIDYLTKMLFAQLGITQGILDGSASDLEMLNYRNRILEPILSSISCEMRRKFLTKNARTRGETIKYFPNPFNMVTVSQIAEIAGVLITNRMITSNEGRQLLGLKPASDPGADALSNPNIDKMVDAGSGSTGPKNPKDINRLSKDASATNTQQSSGTGEVNNQNEKT